MPMSADEGGADAGSGNPVCHPHHPPRLGAEAPCTDLDTPVSGLSQMLAALFSRPGFIFKRCY